MDVNLQQTRYEPLPRWGHVSVVIGNKLYLWGGRIEDFSEESKKEVSLTFHCVYLYRELTFFEETVSKINHKAMKDLNTNKCTCMGDATASY